MNAQALETARALVAGDRGLLAMNEGNPSCGRHLEEAGISQTVEARRDYRELILTARGLGDPVAVECRRAPWGIHVDGSGGGATTCPKERASH